MITIEEEKERLVLKYKYVQVKNRFDMIRANFLLKKLGIEIFKTDEKILEVLSNEKINYDVDHFYLIKDEQGWRSQSHFIGTGNTTDELEKDIKRYEDLKNKDSLSEGTKEEHVEQIYLMLNKFWEISMFLYDNYYSVNDIRLVNNDLDTIEWKLTEMYPNFEGASKFRYRSNFNEVKERFTNHMKKYSRDSKINDVLN